MNMKLLGGALLGAALSAQAAAGTTYFATAGTTLFRVDDGGSVQSFDLGVELSSLSFDADGRLWGGEQDDQDGDQSYALYEVLDPFGSANAVMQGDFLPGRLGSLAMKNSTMLGFETTTGQLLDVDAHAKSWALAAMLGSGTTRPSSSGYDADHDVLYGIRNDTLYKFSTDGLYTQSTVATLFGGETSGSNGGEWYGGKYYHAVNDGSLYHVYTVDVSTGELTEVLNWAVDGRGASGLAVATTPVPTPGAAGLLGLGALTLTRRRR